MDPDGSIPPSPYGQDPHAQSSAAGPSPFPLTQQPSHQNSPVARQFPQGLSHTSPTTPQTPAQVDEVLRKKRKAREYKACYPCRQRKVKCNNTVPCETCVQRQHPELCGYHPPDENHPPAKRPILTGDFNINGLGGDHPGTNGGGFIHNQDGTVTISRELWDRICSQTMDVERATMELKSSLRSAGPAEVLNGTEASLQTGGYHHADPFFNGPRDNEGSTSSRTPTDSMVRHVNAQGIHTRSSVNGETIHLGGSSVPALLVNLSNGDSSNPGLQELLGKSMLPLFGLDNASATYPFVDLWGLPHGSEARADQLARALPTHSQCMNLFNAYKETAYPIFPVLPYFDEFSTDLMMFLINQAKYGPDNWGPGKTDTQEMTIYGQSISWVGLLFAVLASGSQCAQSIPRKERELIANVYVCCSFECLRFVNYLNNATLETVETLLVLGNVISNHMNAGVAWTILGTTIRLAQTLGLHRACPPSTNHNIKRTRKRIWWTVMWQDSLLSITYDRAPGTFSGGNEQPPFTSDGPGNRNYLDCMFGLSKVMLAIVRDRDIARESPPTTGQLIARVAEHRRSLQNIMQDAADYLKDSRRCRDRRDQVEHWVLYLHISYTTSELCRPAISPSHQIKPSNESDAEKLREIRKTCITSLSNTVQAFLGMHNMTGFAVRSWAAVHRSISSALLLGLLGEHHRNHDTRRLLAQLVSVLQDVSRTVNANELNGPITRSITALRKILGPYDPPNADDDGPDDPNGSSQVNIWPPADVSLGPEAVAAATATATAAAGVSAGGLGPWDVDPAIVGYSPDVSLHSDNSPHAMMDSILWGIKAEAPGLV